MKKLLMFGVTALAMLNARAEFIDDLHAKFPQTVGSVVTKSFGNFYAVVKGSEVLYINDDLSVMINGEVVDLKSNKSLTAALRDANRPKIKASDLDLKDAIKLGTGAEKIYVFSDPDCPYCRQLEKEFDKLPGVTVYVFPYPLAGLHPSAIATAESIWCAKDKSSTWREYMDKSVKPLFANCDNPIKRNVAFAEKNHIYGTPAIIFGDGTVIPGAVGASAILAQIETSKKK